MFFIIGLAASGLYVYDIFTDFQVAFVRVRNGWMRIACAAGIRGLSSKPMAGCQPPSCRIDWLFLHAHMPSGHRTWHAASHCPPWCVLRAAQILLNANFNTEAGIVFMLTMAHFFTISIMLGFKFYYHFKMRVLKRIDQ